MKTSQQSRSTPHSSSIRSRLVLPQSQWIALNTFYKQNTPQPQMLNWKFHESRRQSQLNAMFNVRKKRLATITNANTAIHFRINGQMSHYPVRKLLGIKSFKKKYNLEEQNNNVQTPCQSKFSTIDSQQRRNILGPISQFSSKVTLPCHFNDFQSQQSHSESACKQNQTLFKFSIEKLRCSSNNTTRIRKKIIHTKSVPKHNLPEVFTMI